MICFPNSFNVISWPSVILITVFMIVVGLAFRPQFIIQAPQMPADISPVVESNTFITTKGDDRYARSPEAERVWGTAPDLSRVPSHRAPFNIPTQGIPESYQSMGIVKTPDGKLLPLYGRRAISSRERYNYYTRTDSYNPVPMPINIKGRDCQDQVGCPELYNGDTVKLSPTGEIGEVTIYRVSDIVR